MGLTVVDAGVLIGFLDHDNPHHAAAHRSLTAALASGNRLALPASAFAQVLVGPSRRGKAAIDVVRRLLERVPIDVVPLDEAVALTAADLRAHHPEVKLPDALVIATAITVDADVLLTTDRKWPTRRALGLRAVMTVL